MAKRVAEDSSDDDADNKMRISELKFSMYRLVSLRYSMSDCYQYDVLQQRSGQNLNMMSTT